MASSFPLLKLPIEEKIHVLKSMDLIDKVSFSLISKATKSLIVDFNLLGTDNLLTIVVDNRFKIWLNGHSELQFFANDDDGSILTGFVIAWKDSIPCWYWRKSGFDMEDWLDHLMDITIQDGSIDRIFFMAGSDRFNIPSLAKILNGIHVEELLIHQSCDPEYALSILDTIHKDNIMLYRSVEDFQRILIQNFQTFRDAIEDRPTTLNDLLVTNAQFIWFYDEDPIEMKKYNRFLKLWKKGFNGRPAVIQVTTTFVPDSDVILKGIHYFEVDPKDAHPMRPKPSEDSEESKGYDIYGSGGRRATLYISRVERMGLEFCVWE